jgi:hypothetical protein
MKRIVFLAAAALLVSAGRGGASPCCGGGHCTGQCITPPCPTCPDCTEPCHGFRCSLGKCPDGPISDLHACDCCTRIRAAKHLGNKLCYNFCKDCSILPALVEALLVDKCWEVRRAAAWSIAMQGARTELGVLALYISSKIDPHYMVRDKATDSLDVLLVCRKDCFKCVFEMADELIKTLRKEKLIPGSDLAAGILASLPGHAAIAVMPGTVGEVILPGPAGRPGGPPPVEFEKARPGQGIQEMYAVPPMPKAGDAPAGARPLPSGPAPTPGRAAPDGQVIPPAVPSQPMSPARDF